MFGILDYISLFLIFIFGVPHGAFDASIALTLGYYKNLISKLFFYINLSVFSLNCCIDMVFITTVYANYFFIYKYFSFWAW